MKKTLIAAVSSSMLILGMTTAAMAADPATTTRPVPKGASQITLEGSVRVRGGYDNYTGATAYSSGTSYYDGRVQLGVSAKVSEQASGYVKLEPGMYDFYTGATVYTGVSYDDSLMQLGVFSSAGGTCPPEDFVPEIFVVGPNTNAWGTQTLAPGWNLVGNSTDSALEVASNFGDVNNVVSVWKWVPATGTWEFYSPSMSPLELADYTANMGFDILTSIDSGEGFWVNVKISFTPPMPVDNGPWSPPPTPGDNAPLPKSFQNKLSAGWNLIAIDEVMPPGQFNVAIGTAPALPIPSNLTSIWAWDNPSSTWYFYSPGMDAQGGAVLTDYLTSKGYLDFTSNNKLLGPGVGFWANKP